MTADTDIERTLFVAASLGREMVASVLEHHDPLPPASDVAIRDVDRLVVPLLRVMEALPEAELQSVGAQIAAQAGQALDALSRHDRFGTMIADGNDAFESYAETTGEGGSASRSKARSLVLAIAALVALGKFHANLDVAWDSDELPKVHIQAGLSEGVSAGIVELAAAIAAVAAGKPVQLPSGKDKDKKPPIPPARGKPALPSAGPSGADATPVEVAPRAKPAATPGPTDATERQSVPTIRSPLPVTIEAAWLPSISATLRRTRHALPFSEAEALKNEVASLLTASKFRDVGIWRDQIARNSPTGFRAPREIKDSVGFAVGLFRVPSDAGDKVTGSGDGAPVFRVGVRVILPGLLLKAARNAVAAYFDRHFGPAVSVRSSTRVVTLQAVSDHPVSIGSAMRIEGGAQGRIGLLVEDETSRLPFAVTAGHLCVDADGEPLVGASALVDTMLHTDPDVSAPPMKIGEVDYRVHVFGPARPGVVPSGPGDLALVALRNGFVPYPPATRRMGNHHIEADIAKLDVQSSDLTPRVLKASGLTPEAYGVVRQFEVVVDMVDDRTGHHLRGSGLLEIELKDGEVAGSIARGESGNLLCVTKGGFAPFAIVVAGARNARLDVHDRKSYPVVYATPLATHPAMTGMRII